MGDAHTPTRCASLVRPAGRGIPFAHRRGSRSAKRFIGKRFIGKSASEGDRMSQPPEGKVRVEDYVKGELSKDTNWWGAFVVGLAGTILVTGVTPAVLGPLGAAAIPNFIFWALTGWLLCLFLAELAAMLPD